MLFTTPTQFAVLAVCLIAGWLFGLASAPGGRKWKDRLREAEAAHATYRKDAEQRVKDAEARANSAEAERDRYAKATPVAAPVAPQGAAIQGVPPPERDRDIL